MNRAERLKELLNNLQDEREHLDAILFNLRGEPKTSAALSRIDLRLAAIQALAEAKLRECTA